MRHTLTERFVLPLFIIIFYSFDMGVVNRDPPLSSSSTCSLMACSTILNPSPSLWGSPMLITSEYVSVGGGGGERIWNWGERRWNEPCLAQVSVSTPHWGVRGEEFVTYSDVINIGLPIGEGLGGSLGLASDCKVTTLFLLYKIFACFFCVNQFEIFVINQ